MNKTINIIFTVALSCPLVSFAQSPIALKQEETARARLGEQAQKDQVRFRRMIDVTAEVYEGIAKGAHGEVPATVLKNARCIAVLPNVITGAFVVGGTHGEGLASCKIENGTQWSQPAPITLNQGSIGLQAGAKSADLVLFFQSKDAVQALKRGNFSLGADVSAVAGNYDSNVDTSNAGVLVYTRTEGLFAGASVNGSNVGSDQDDLERFYGKKIEYRDILESRETPDSSGYTTKLTKLFP